MSTAKELKAKLQALRAPKRRRTPKDLKARYGPTTTNARGGKLSCNRSSRSTFAGLDNKGRRVYEHTNSMDARLFSQRCLRADLYVYDGADVPPYAGARVVVSKELIK